MKLKALVTTSLAVAAVSFGQTPNPAVHAIYSVPADSKGNTITLTVANESKSMDASEVRVQVQRCPEGMKFASGSNLIKIVRATKESDVSFAFDVSRDVKLNTKDTVEFLVSDRQGILGYKSVVVSYSGPTVYKLDQNFPNPFNPSTTIYYQLPVASKVTIIIYDVLGREVRKLVDEVKEAGYQSVKFEANRVASGTYICRMVADPVSGGKGYIAVKKMLVLK